MTVAPGLTVRVHDDYVAGEGILHAALGGLVSLVELRGASPEPGGVAHGEFMWFVAEAAWYPTALLPSQGARWSAVDEHSAQVDLADGALVAWLTPEGRRPYWRGKVTALACEFVR